MGKKKEKKNLTIASLKNIGDGKAVGPGYKPGRDKALDAAIKAIREGKVRDSSGLGTHLQVKKKKKKKTVTT